MTDLISFAKILDHERLCERLLTVRGAVDAARSDGPDLPASPLLVATAGTLLDAVYRLISRDAGARDLPRPDRRQPPSHRQLAAMLRDARLALATFADVHRDHDDEFGDEWLTIEGIADFLGRGRNLSPSDPDAA